jgi:ketosteroid isomerase-like protein
VSSEANVELVRHALDALNQDDPDLAAELFAADVELDWSRSLGPLRGTYRGREGLRALWGEFWGTFEDVRVEADDFIVAGQDVLVPNTAHLRGRDGVELVARSTFVYTVENGRVTRLCLFQDLAEARAR